MERGIKPITDPVVIAVEGLDYLHMLLNGIITASAPIQGVRLWDWKAERYTIRQGISALASDTAFVTRKVSSLGIIADAEDDRNRVEAQIRETLRDLKLPVPPKQMELATDGTIRTGYLVMPHDRPSGCLEHACIEASSLNNQHVGCVHKYYNEVAAHLKSHNDNFQVKIKVHALIAGSGKNPALTLGQSAAAGLWDFSKRPIGIMREFIDLMRVA